jgi:hypothetical protein
MGWRAVIRACETCNGSRLKFGGWMGPTPEAPTPEPCGDCSAGMTLREIQVVQTEWLLDNRDRPDVKQILARMAVHEAGTYRKVVRAEISRLVEWGGDQSVLSDADLIVGIGNIVLKDRYGMEGYKLSDTEMRRIMEDCAEPMRVPY